MALSNTTENTLRTTPYYDDYYEVANTTTGLLRGDDFDFHRIMFRPRYGVQARELTQIQTLLQSQLEHLGTTQFRDGDRVLGASLTIDTSANSGQVLATTNLASFFNRTTNDGKYVYAKVAGITDLTTTGRITQFVSIDDAETTNNYLVFKYTSTNTFGPEGVIQDRDDATVTATFAAGANSSVFHSASTISVDEGVMFVSGFFVRVKPQTIVLDALTNTPSYRVGMEVVEEFLDELDDVVGASLLDEANRSAVGAHRFRVRLTLSKRAITDTADAGFIEIARVVDGQILYTQSNAKYVTAAELKLTLARRTYDESGDYMIRPFLPVVEAASLANSTNSADITTLQLSLSSGKAYVRGFEMETTAPVRLSIDKGRTTESATNRTLPATVGSYLLVNRVSGTTAPNNYFVGTTTVDVHSVAPTSIDTASATTYAYSKIGTAKVRMLESYSVPLAAAISELANSSVYKLFTYDWNFTSLTGNLASIATIVDGAIQLPVAVGDGFPAVNTAITGATVVLSGADSPVSGTFTANSYHFLGSDAYITLKEYLSVLPNANTTYRLLFQPRDVDAFTLYDATKAYDNAIYADNLSFQANVAPAGKINGTPNGHSLISSTGTNKLIYQLPEKFIESGSIDTSTATFSTWHASASNTRTFSSATSAALSLSFAGNTFSIPAGTYTAEEARKYFTIFDITADANGYGQVVQFTDSTPTGSERAINGVSISSAGSPTGSEYHLSFTYYHGASTSDTRTFIATGKALVTGSSARTKNYYVGNTTSYHASATTALVNGQVEYHTLNTAPSFAYSLRTHDVTNLRKVLYKSSNTVFSTGDMSTATDVTSHFRLDTGQRDNHYNYGRAIVGTGASAVIVTTGRLLFIFDHFMHSGIGYATVDSYLSTNNIDKGMTYDTIPTYVSPKYGRGTNLRACLDFRVAQGHYGAATGNVALVFASTNTSANSTYAASDGTPYLIPVSDDIWNGDYDYYLARKDTVSITANGAFHVTKGQAAVFPEAPHIEASDLLLYRLTIPAYTLVDAAGIPHNVTMKSYNYKRYTMRDIAKVDDRVKRVEYYTALSQLERLTLDTTELDADDNERFKNGIVVDNFTSTGTAHVSHIDFAASIDTRKHVLHSAFRSFSTQFSTDYANTTTANITVVGDIAIPAYTTEEFISQPLATKSVSVNPFDIGSFYGKIRLSPAVDTWKSTTTLPAQVIDGGGPTQAWINANLPAYTVWGEWNTTWTATETVDDEPEHEEQEEQEENGTEWRNGIKASNTHDGAYRSWEAYDNAHPGDQNQNPPQS